MAGKREGDQEIAFLTHQTIQPCAFCAHHQRQRPFQVGPVIGGRLRPRLQTYQPDALRLKVFYRSGQVRHQSDSEMFYGSGGSVADRRCDTCRATLRQDRAMRTHCLCRAQERTKVLRVLQVIQDEEKGRLAPGFCRLEQVIQIAVRKGADLRGDSLVMHAQGIQLRTQNRPHRTTTLPGSRHDLGHDAAHSNAFGQYHLDESSSPRAQRLSHHLSTVKDLQPRPRGLRRCRLFHLAGTVVQRDRGKF